MTMAMVRRAYKPKLTELSLTTTGPCHQLTIARRFKFHPAVQFQSSSLTQLLSLRVSTNVAMKTGES
jgi:hypothetical protein